MYELHFHVRKTSNGYYVRVTKGFWDAWVIKRFVAKDMEDLAKQVAETVEALKD